MCVLVWLLACTPGMHPDMLEEWWRPACVLDMQPDMWSTRCHHACVRSHAKRHTGCHQPEADWLVSPINTPRHQLIYSHPDLSTGSDQSKFCSILRREVRRTVQELKEVLSRSVCRGLSVSSWRSRGSVQVEISSVQSSQVIPWVLAMSSPINQLLLA
ncbi:hypothetical protein F2Q69_00044783 [Brassica cretica]|uniref:Uncharacterized protein n=1 Tax=Brassica cretica TaxID=69181 RepID=A0A8S9NV87_BRACR|nr:hypothetical protein F2Q69_00044783 [Brassica cretica]